MVARSLLCDWCEGTGRFAGAAYYRREGPPETCPRCTGTGLSAKVAELAARLPVIAGYVRRYGAGWDQAADDLDALAALLTGGTGA